MLDMFELAWSISGSSRDILGCDGDKFIADIAIRFEYSMQRPDLRRGLNLGEMISAALRAAYIYTRVGGGVGRIKDFLYRRCDLGDWTHLSLQLVNVLQKIKSRAPAAGWTNNNVLDDFWTEQWRSLKEGRELVENAQNERVAVADYLQTSLEMPAMTRATEHLAELAYDQLQCWKSFDDQYHLAALHEHQWIEYYERREWFRSVDDSRASTQNRPNFMKCTATDPTTGQMKHTLSFSQSVEIKRSTSKSETSTMYPHRRHSQPSGVICRSWLLPGVSGLTNCWSTRMVGTRNCAII